MLSKVILDSLHCFPNPPAELISLVGRIHEILYALGPPILYLLLYLYSSASFLALQDTDVAHALNHCYLVAWPLCLDRLAIKLAYTTCRIV